MGFRRALRTSALVALVAGTALTSGKVSGQKLSSATGAADTTYTHTPIYKLNMSVLAGQRDTYGGEIGLNIGPVGVMYGYVKSGDRILKNNYRSFPGGVKGFGKKTEINNDAIEVDLEIDEEISEHMADLPLVGGLGAIVGLSRRDYKEVADEKIVASDNTVLDSSHNEKNGIKFSPVFGIASRFSAKDLFYYDKGKGTQIRLTVKYDPDSGYSGSVGVSIPLDK